MPIIEAIEEITSAIDQKNYVMGVVVELKKAFDTIKNDILINKLERYGIRWIVLDWVRSYLSKRQVCEVGKIQVSMFGHCLWCLPWVSVGTKTVYFVY